MHSEDGAVLFVLDMELLLMRAHHVGHAQAALRGARGEEVTAFERMEDGGRAISKGDVVRLAVKPAVVGAVLHFSVPQVGPAQAPGHPDALYSCCVPAIPLSFASSMFNV